MQTVVLTGGMGTRLGRRTTRQPKALVRVQGRTFLAHQLELLAQLGVTEVVLCVGYRASQVERFAGDGSRWGLQLRYSDDGPQLLGTGGALRRALPLLAPSFAVVYGDTYLPLGYLDLLRMHGARGRPATMAVYQNRDRWDHSNVILDGDRVAIYDKNRRDPRMTWIDAGVSALERSWVAGFPAEGPVDLADRFRELARTHRLGAYQCAQRFYEVGSPAGLTEFRRLVARDRAVARRRALPRDWLLCKASPA